MAASVRSTSSAVLAASTSHSITLPPGVQFGDVLVVAFAYDNVSGGGNTASTTSPGWVTLDRQEQGAGTNVAATLFWKRATGSDSLTVTLAKGEDAQSQEAAYVAVAVEGGGDPLFAGTNAGSAPATLAAVAVTAGDYLSLLFVGTDANQPADRTITPPSTPVNYSNLDEAEATGSGSWVSMYALAGDEPVTTSTSIAPGDVGFSPSDQWISFNVAVPEGEVATTETHRFYLTNQSAGFEPGTPNHFNDWQDTSAAAARLLGSTPGGAADSASFTETSTDTAFRSLLRQFVSHPATAAGTITGNWQQAAGWVESNADADLKPYMTVWVTQGDSDDYRGGDYVVYVGGSPGLELATDPAARVFAQTPVQTSVDFEVGDRIVVELGLYATNDVATPYEGTLYYGGTGSPDMSSGGTDMNRPGWVDLDITPGVTFERPPSAPGAVFDLSNWKITLPTEDPNDPGDALEIRQPELDTYFDEHFYLDADDQMVMRAPTSGDGIETTGGSDGSRAEFREMEDGEEAGWDLATTGPRRLTVTGVFDPTSITGGTGPRKEEIVGQIHGPSGTPPLYLSVEFTTGAEGNPTTPHLRVYKDGPGVDPNLLAPLTATTEITYRIDIDRDEGDGENHVKVYTCVGGAENLPSEPDFDWAASEFTEDTSECYLKAGAYNKTPVESGSSGEAKATITHLQLIQAETRRFYLSSLPSTTSDVPVAEWVNDPTGAETQHLLTEEPAGAPDDFSRAETTSTTPWYVFLGRWVSTPVSAAGTVYGDWRLAAGLLESSPAADFQPLLVVHVADESGDDQGTVISVFVDDYELPTGTASETGTGPGTGSGEVELQVGDRLVVSLGYVAQNDVSTSYTGTLHFGGTDSPDLAAGDTDFDRPAWVDLTTSPGLTFESPAEPVTGELDGALPTPTAALAGTVTGAGSLAGTLPVPTSAIAGTVTAGGQSSSVRFDEADDRLYYLATTLPDPAVTGLTVVGWWRIRVNRDAFSTFYRTSDAGTIQSCATFGSGSGVNVFTTSGELNSDYTTPVDEWFSAAVVASGADTTLYVRPVGGTTTSSAGTVGTGAPAQLCIGGRALTDATEWLNGNAAYVRVFADALTQSEVEAEWDSTTAVLAAWADWPLQGASDLVDHSGNGRDLTPVGTGPTTEDGPPIGPVSELASTLPMVEAALSTTVTASGTLSTSLPAPSAALTGSVAASGSLAAAIPAPTVELTGTVRAEGSLAGTFPTPTAAASGTVTAGGTLSGGLPSPEAALAGSVTTSGALAGVLPLPTAAMASAAPGLLSAGLPLPTSAVTGSVTTTGALDATLPLPRAAIGAGGLVIGELGGSLPTPGAAIAAHVAVQGALSASLPAPLAELFAEDSRAQLVALLSMPSVDLAAAVTALAELAAALPMPTAALTTFQAPGPVLHAGPPVQLVGHHAGPPVQLIGLRAGEPTELDAGS